MKPTCWHIQILTVLVTTSPSRVTCASNRICFHRFQCQFPRQTWGTITTRVAGRLNSSTPMWQTPKRFQCPAERLLVPTRLWKSLLQADYLSSLSTRIPCPHRTLCIHPNNNPCGQHAVLEVSDLLIYFCFLSRHSNIPKQNHSPNHRGVSSASNFSPANGKLQNANSLT